MRQAGIKPKLLFSRNDAIVTAREARSHDDFAIYATD